MILRKRWKWLIISFFSVIITLPVIFYWQRNSILEAFVQEKIKMYEQEKPVKISYGKINLSGLNSLKVSKLYVVPTNNDTLAHVKDVTLKLNLWQLLWRKVEVEDLQIDGLTLSLIDNNGKRNFDFLLPQKDKKLYDDRVPDNYTQKATRLLSLFFQLIPEDILITGMNISIQSSSFSFSAHIPELKIEGDRFHSQVSIKEKRRKQSFALEGSFHHKNKELECKIYALDGQPACVPYLQYKYDTQATFDTLQFRFHPLKERKDLLQLEGTVSLVNLDVRNMRLSAEKIRLCKSAIDYVVNIRPDYLELDSATTVRFNRLQFHPYVRIKTKPALDLTVSIQKKNFPASHLFSSLPEGLFRNLEGIRTSGKLSYNFFFALNMANVDSLKFQSSLSKRNFKIEHFGQTDFTKVREPFPYSAYEQGELVKTFEVGYSYANFRPLSAISPYLKAAVLFAEDGFFYAHSGFVEDALRSSFIKNIKEKRFARGGSTISMQLVKNLYLNRDKTLARKLEEILIVWLIENNRILSKERMFEIYLNIIEWGPGIYGANAASLFYFRKDVSELTPEEAIFMASIIPRPKKFFYLFNERGELKPFLSGFYRIVGMRMLNHGYLTEEQHLRLIPGVQIKGAASSYLKQANEMEAPEQQEEDWNVFGDRGKYENFFK